MHAWFNDSVNGAAPLKYKPLVISSEKFLLHSGRSYHPESPARIAGCLSMIKRLDDDGLIANVKPKAEDNGCVLTGFATQPSPSFHFHLMQDTSEVYGTV